jgi:putative hydrolase of the HAD superfamily
VTIGVEIEAVVFDWGGVLVETGGFAGTGARVIEERLGLPSGSMPGILGLDPYETDLTNLWHRRELGLATALEWAEWYRDRVAAAGGVPIEAANVVATERDRFTLPPNEVVRAVLPALKAAGLRLGICTNNFVELSDVWQAGLPLELFDVVAVSCDLGLRKPDQAMFDHVVATLGVAPAATVLLDDLPANVAGARRAGWHAILVEPDARSALDALHALVGGADG